MKKTILSFVSMVFICAMTLVSCSKSDDDPVAAKITTAPVATAGTIEAGSETPLVTAGVAENGTMMYKVLPANEAKPTTTEGFSDKVPTASNRAEGTYNVWYYVKGNSGYTNSAIAGPIAVTLEPAGNVVDISTLTANYTAQDGDILTGTLNGETQKYKITIADGATVTLKNATVNGWDDNAYYAGVSSVAWAGITCEGDATIILKDGSENTVKGFFSAYPGVYVPQWKTLVIKGGTAGTGKLNASSNGSGAGIGGGNGLSCGNIEIQSGFITAQGGDYAAGIGGSEDRACGTIKISGGTIEATAGTGGAGIGSGGSNDNDSGCDGITISGGTVTATGGQYSVGIGAGYWSKAVNVTITNGVTKVTAIKGSEAPNSIGASKRADNGTVTIGGTVTGNITESPYIYEPGK